jgi:hypothetical protein
MYEFCGLFMFCHKYVRDCSQLARDYTYEYTFVDLYTSYCIHAHVTGTQLKCFAYLTRQNKYSSC